MATDRRTFLKRGLIGGAVLVVGSGAYLGLRGPALRHAPAGPLYVLDGATFAILAAVAARVASFDEADPVRIAHGVDVALQYLPVEGQADLKRALRLLDNGLAGLFTRGSATPFTQLSPDAQDAALTRWACSSVAVLRSAFDALRKLCLAAHYAELENARAIGYPGVPFDKPDPGPIEPRAPLSPPFVVEPEALP